jgi:hypothetical protein
MVFFPEIFGDENFGHLLKIHLLFFVGRMDESLQAHHVRLFVQRRLEIKTPGIAGVDEK